MGIVFRLAELLLVLVPLAGALYGVFRAISAARGLSNEPATAPSQELISAAEPRTPTVSSQAAQWRTITRVLDEHKRTDARWLTYELDAAKLLDFPLLTDMREPLTMGFHRAKLRADLLRPRAAEDLLDNPDAARDYLDAVEKYATAFDAAEAEAIRRRRTDFAPEEQQRMSRAQSLLRVASDARATPHERAQAYGVARRELDGLIVLPDKTFTAIEQGIAGELGK